VRTGCGWACGELVWIEEGRTRGVKRTLSVVEREENMKSGERNGGAIRKAVGFTLSHAHTAPIRDTHPLLPGPCRAAGT